MKTRVLCLVVVALFILGGTRSSLAWSDGTPEAVAADILVVRPFCLVATILGSAVFVVGLPVAAITKSTDKAADALDKAPADATFKRPVGNFSSMQP